MNHTSRPFDDFANDTWDQHGHKAEILDAFVFANGEISDRTGNVRLRKSTLLYGETLFFGANAQAPVDYILLLSVLNSQFKEINLPVNQFSG